MDKCCIHYSTFIFDRIFVKLANKNEDRHKSRTRSILQPDLSLIWQLKITGAESLVISIISHLVDAYLNTYRVKDLL